MRLWRRYDGSIGLRAKRLLRFVWGTLKAMAAVLPLVVASGSVAAPGVIGVPVSCAGLVDYTAKFSISGPSGGSIRLGLEDSVDGVNFTPLCVVSLPLGKDAATHVRSYDLPGLAVVAAATVRVNVYQLVGGPAHVNCHIV